MDYYGDVGLILFASKDIHDLHVACGHGEVLSRDIAYPREIYDYLGQETESIHGNLKRPRQGIVNEL